MATNTITPEVGGLWVPANPEHAKLGWTYDFEQVERIAMAAHKSTGYDATLEVVDFVMAEADRRHATALAAKDARISELDHIANHWLAAAVSRSTITAPAR